MLCTEHLLTILCCYVCESDKHKYAVTCEIGQQKYRTDVVKDIGDNPVFNKEFHLYVVLLLHLFNCVQ